jgi:HAD superfamily hydrolase (TIGR01549 family)
MKLVIFDFDGTIAELDIPWEQVKADAVQLANSFDVEVDSSLPMMEVSNVLSEYPDLKEPLYRYSVFPGMKELVLDLKAKGYKLAVASANCVPTIGSVLSEMGILDSFDLVMGRESAEKNKPNPHQLIAIMEGLDIPKEEVLYIGNMVYDKEAAQAAGVSFFDITGHGPKVEGLRGMLL